MVRRLSVARPSAQHIANQKAASGRRAPVFEGGDGLLEGLFRDMGRREDDSACSDQDSFEILDDIGKGGRPRTAAEEHPVVAESGPPGFVQEADQPAADVRVVSEPVVASDVGVPERMKPRRLGPEAKDVVVVIGQHDPASRADSTDHSPDDGQRVGDMLEQEPGVREVKSTPLAVAEAEDQGRRRA